MFINIVRFIKSMVEFDELLITTGVDALVRIVKQKQRIEMSEASAALDIPESTIEEWAGILEEQGILKIEYRLTKVFLAWIQPTRAEVTEAKESIYRKKSLLREDINKVRQSVAEQIGSVSEMEKSFVDMYSKISPELAALEKKLEKVHSSKELSSGKLEQELMRIDSISSRFGEMKNEIEKAHAEISAIEGQVGKQPAKKVMERGEKLSAELGKLKDGMASLKKKTGQYEKTALPAGELPRISEIREKVAQLTKTHLETKERSAKLKQDLIELSEGKDILKTIGQSMKGYDKKITTMRKEIAGLSAQASELTAHSTQIAKKVEADKDTLERFADSMNVAKGILARFPAQKTVKDELEKIRKSEKTIDENTKALTRLLEIASGAKVAAVNFDELSASIDEKIDEISSEMEELSESLEQEKTTYLTFQKIRERIIPSLEKYKNEIEALSSQIAASKKELSEQVKSLEGEASKLSKEIDKDEVRHVMEVAEQVKEKRQLLEKIRETLRSLSASSESLGKRLSILSKHASLLEIRSAEEPSETRQKEKDEISEQLSLTRAEEEEFKRKREELRSLIKRLWEEKK